MSRLVDNLVAYRILSMLVTPFEETQAYKLGIIDSKGKILKKASSLSTAEEKDAYTYLNRLVFNLKRILLKLPGGDSKLKNIVAAYWLVKECYQKNESTALLEDKFTSLVQLLEAKNIVLVEEEIQVIKFLESCQKKKEVEEEVANVTGAAVSTDAPVIKQKDIKKYQNSLEENQWRIKC